MSLLLALAGSPPSIVGTVTQTVVVSQTASSSVAIQAAASQLVLIAQTAAGVVDDTSTVVPDAPRVGGGSRPKVFIGDMIWPDDPRHPQYVGRDLPVEDVAPKREPVVVKLKPRVPAPPVAVAIKPDTTDFDRALALLLLAA